MPRWIEVNVRKIVIIKCNKCGTKFQGNSVNEIVKENDLFAEKKGKNIYYSCQACSKVKRENKKKKDKMFGFDKAE